MICINVISTVYFHNNALSILPRPVNLHCMFAMRIVITLVAGIALLKLCVRVYATSRCQVVILFLFHLVSCHLSHIYPAHTVSHNTTEEGSDQLTKCLLSTKKHFSQWIPQDLYTNVSVLHSQQLNYLPKQVHWKYISPWYMYACNCTIMAVQSFIQCILCTVHIMLVNCRPMP